MLFTALFFCYSEYFRYNKKLGVPIFSHMYLVHSQFHIHVSVLLRLSIDYPWSPPVSTGQALVRNPGEGPSRYPTKFSKTTWISNLGELSCQLLTTSRVCVALGACGKRKTIINQQNAMLYYRCRESGHHRGKRSNYN